MKQILLLIAFFSLFSPRSQGQGENNMCTFDLGGHKPTINFNLSPVTLSAIPAPVENLGLGAAVCYPNGQLRFFVKLTPNSFMASWNNIYHPDGTPIANSDLRFIIEGAQGAMPFIVPHPGNADQYYIFYMYSNGLLYSLLDMSLNNGAGGIASGQKDVVLSAYATIIGGAMTAVKGCGGAWALARSRIANQYYSYAITANGVDHTPVISEIGSLPADGYSLGGSLKASPDGSKLAVAGCRGVELYDFERCSGKVKNARILDTASNAYPYLQQSIFTRSRFHGLCFSPDNSKLYATYNKGAFGLLESGKLFQYDVSLPDLQSIIASKTLVLTNQPSMVDGWSGFCNYSFPNPMWDIKAGPNGKIYVDNGSWTCIPLAFVPSGHNPGPAFHVLHQPNALGTACQPEYNVIIAEGFGGTTSFDFGVAGDGGGARFQQDIVIASPRPDTIAGQISFPFVCFNDSLLLTADPNGSCYLWDDSSTVRTRTVYHSGTYFVRYFKDCNITTDTFHVSLVKLPVLTTMEQSCPGMSLGKLAAIALDTTLLHYLWRKSDGSILRQYTSKHGDTISGLQAGTYFLKISSSNSCDTIVSAAITNMPKPEVNTAPADTTIRYGDSLTLRADGGLLYVWWPTGVLDSATNANPTARPLANTLFFVLGLNEYGCRDTGYVNVNIDYTMPDLVPNAFSPNGDGVNDVFRIEGITYQKLGQFSVFNRYGQRIFETVDAKAGWDGSFNEKPCDMGIYYYLIQLLYPDGKTKTLKGDVLLIR